MDELDVKMLRVAQHAFPGTFQPRGRDRAVVDLCGIPTVHGHTEELVRPRASPGRATT